MNIYNFKKVCPRHLLAMLVLIILASGAKANDFYQENDKAWWEISTEAIKNLWTSSTKTVEDLIEQSTKPVSEKNARFAEVWEKVTPTLDQLLQLEQEDEQLPESAWFSTDKEDNQGEINELLDEAVAILSISNTAQTRQHIRAIEKKIREMKQTISQYRQAKISAPIRSTWQTTVADYDVKIKQLIDLIKKSKQAIIKLKSRFALQLSEKGLTITQEQLDVLLSSVVGDDIIQTSIVYDNVKQISQQLMNLTIKSGEDIDISQRYYGMYTVLLKTLLHMQQGFINNINEKYLAKIDEIVADVQDINVTTQNLLRGEQDKIRRQHLLANLEAQKLTLQTASLYNKHLIRQRAKMAIATKQTSTDLQIAQNTYKTVRVGGELINLLRASQKSFDLLLNIQVPDLLMFENKQMKQEFAILTKKLAK